MVNAKDELVHESKEKDFIESYRLHAISKKERWYSFISILWDPRLDEVSIFGLMYFYDNIVKKLIVNKIDTPKKVFGSKELKYTILQPLQESKLQIKESNLVAEIGFKDFFPYYDFSFPKNVQSADVTGMGYFTRCQSAIETQFTHNAKQVKKSFECIGFKEHVWGVYNYPHVQCDSRVIVHFRDQSIALRYIEYKDIVHSYGCIMRKAGNLALILVELEYLSIKNNIFESSEFTYKDAQDDIDLIVSTPIRYEFLDVPKNVKKTHIHVMSFSDFTIIGTNKKGYGIEEHFIALDRLKRIT